MQLVHPENYQANRKAEKHDLEQKIEVFPKLLIKKTTHILNFEIYVISNKQIVQAN